MEELRGLTPEEEYDESERLPKSAPRKNTVRFPAITKFNDYVMRHFASFIVEDIRQRVYEGELAPYLGISDYIEGCISLRDCSLYREMTFWWQDRYSLLADIEVHFDAAIDTDTVRERRNGTFFMTLEFSFEDQITYSIVEFSFDKPEREMILLDDYLIPVMSYDEVEEAAMRMWYMYLPRAMNDRKLVDAFRLTEAMGLNIMSLKLYRQPKTKSVLYWTDSKIQVVANTNEGETSIAETSTGHDEASPTEKDAAHEALPGRQNPEDHGAAPIGENTTYEVLPGRQNPEDYETSPIEENTTHEALPGKQNPEDLEAASLEITTDDTEEKPWSDKAFWARIMRELESSSPKSDHEALTIQNAEHDTTLPDGIVEITVPADTIVTNQNLIHIDRRSLYIFHECFHAEYHWLFYKLQNMYNNDLKTLKKKRKPRNQSREPKNPLTVLEWEAKQGSQALMMPRSLVLPQIWKYAEEARQNTRHVGIVMQSVGRRLSDEWNVPKYLVRARMLHLGYWQAQGALNYVKNTMLDQGYIRPFMFDHESSPTTATTFVISPLDSFKLYETNDEYRARIDSGNYVYVDGHICLNDPEYVIQTNLGPHMTDWANRHIDKCCLRFENVYVVDENYEFRLNSINSDEEYNRHYIDFAVQGKDLSPKEILQRQTEILEKMPDKPGQALKYLMDLCGVTQNEMAERAGVSPSTIRNWCNEEYRFSAVTAFRIIIALHLPPWLSGRFLEVSCVVLKNYGIHLLFRNMIACNFMDSLTELISMLAEAGYTIKELV